MDTLLEPLFFLLDADRRIYFEYLLSSFFLASVVLFLSSPMKRGVGAILSRVFARDIWLNRSSLTDVSLLAVNVWLKILVWIPLFFSAFSVAFYTVKLTKVFLPAGFEPFVGLSELTITALYTLVLVLGLDFSRYALHRLMHRSELLWRFHSVHHSAKTMTPLTLYRVHPVESLLQYLRDILITGVITGVFFVVFGPGIDVVTIAGVNIARFIFNHAGANLRHSHIWLSFGALEHLLISPAQHQIHHSSCARHIDKNFGSQFSIWDRIFGTLYIASEKENLKFGLCDRQV